MTRRYSSFMGVSAKSLKGQGAFDGFVEIDSPFHIDPYLLRAAQAKELRGSHRRFRRHFRQVLALLAASTRRGDRSFRAAVDALTFPELKGVALGYSKGGSSGSGIGPSLAKSLATTAGEILSAGIKDPVIFELAGLFEEGIGADRISDMTVQIILPHLLRFSQRVAKQLKLKTTSYTWEDLEYQIPCGRGKGRAIILVPEELLRDLPVALDWSDIDRVCRYNAALRRAVNKVIGRTWKHATRRITKRQLRDALLGYPDLMRDLIAQYNEKQATHYDFRRDPEGYLAWEATARDFATRFPLALAAGPGKARLQDTVLAICSHFKHLVEHNGLNLLFYERAGRLRHERFAQLLFFGLADTYCDANDLDLSREPNAGRGAVDFKLSSGYHARVLVEVKYSSHQGLRSAFERQLPTYAQSEKSKSAILLIIRTTPSSRQIDAIRRLRSAALRKGRRVPDIIVVDARLKESASKL